MLKKNLIKNSMIVFLDIHHSYAPNIEPELQVHTKEAAPNTD